MDQRFHEWHCDWIFLPEQTNSCKSIKLWLFEILLPVFLLCHGFWRKCTTLREMQTGHETFPLPRGFWRCSNNCACYFRQTRLGSWGWVQFICFLVGNSTEFSRAFILERFSRYDPSRQERWIQIVFLFCILWILFFCINWLLTIFPLFFHVTLFSRLAPFLILELCQDQGPLPPNWRFGKALFRRYQEVSASNVMECKDHCIATGGCPKLVIHRSSSSSCLVFETDEIFDPDFEAAPSLRSSISQELCIVGKRGSQVQVFDHL